MWEHASFMAVVLSKISTRIPAIIVAVAAIVAILQRRQSPSDSHRSSRASLSGLSSASGQVRQMEKQSVIRLIQPAKYCFVLFGFLVISPPIMADEYWQFVEINCNRNLHYFSLRTLGYYNPTDKQLAAEAGLKTAQQLQDQHVKCQLNDGIEIEVRGHCSSNGNDCAPGRGPTRQWVAILVNGEHWQLSGGPARSGWIEFGLGPYFHYSLSHFVEISAGFNHTAKEYYADGRHCYIREQNVAPRYSSYQYREVDAECTASPLRRDRMGLHHR